MSVAEDSGQNAKHRSVVAIDDGSERRGIAGEHRTHAKRVGVRSRGFRWTIARKTFQDQLLLDPMACRLSRPAT